MPTRAPRACSQWPCPNVATYRGKCASCNAKYERQRGSSTERGYDAEWRKLRAYKLSISPVCEIKTHCLGAVANEVDHIIPFEGPNDPKRLDLDNLQSTCKKCHDAKSERERRAGGT